MSLQQFLELADCRVGLTQWSRQIIPESGSRDLEGPVTEACVSARDHTGGNIRWAKPTAANIWDKLAIIGQLIHSLSFIHLFCKKQLTERNCTIKTIERGVKPFSDLYMSRANLNSSTKKIIFCLMCLSVCLSVCQQDNWKSFDKFWWKFL